MMELVAENKDKFVKFLRLIQHAQKHEDGIELEDGVNVTEQFVHMLRTSYFQRLLSMRSTYCAIEIDDILSEKNELQLEGALWTPGGVQNFKSRNTTQKKLKVLSVRVCGIQPFGKGTSKVQTQRLLSIRGLGGYGETTLARELIYELLARR